MKRKLSATIFLLLALAGVFQARAQASIWVNQTDGQKPFELGKLRTVTFDGTGLSLNLTDHSNSHYVFSSVKSLTFSGIQASGISTLANATKSISLYPTSAKEQIFLANLPEGENGIVIFRTDGTVVMQTRISSNGEAIQVSSLPGGFYLVKVNNQILKFYKL